MSTTIIGYYGSKPVYVNKNNNNNKRNKLVTFTTNIGGGFMDFSKITNSLKNIAKHSATLLIGILIGITIMLISGKNAQADIGRSDISLTDIQVAWIPESEQVIFLDRKTNSVTKLSKDVVFAIFSLKMASMQQEFTAVTKPANTTTKKQSPSQGTINPNTPK